MLGTLEHVHEHLDVFINRWELRRLAACGTGIAKVLCEERRIGRLLRHGHVQHAFHLVPEDFLSAREQMFLAAVSVTFYRSGLNWYGTQTLVPWEVRQVQVVYADHLQIHLATRTGICRACDNRLLQNDDGDGNYGDRVRTGVRRQCAVMLQRNQRMINKLQQCRMLTELGCALFKDWLGIVQARESLRYESDDEFQEALLLAGERIRLPGPWRIAGQWEAGREWPVRI